MATGKQAKREALRELLRHETMEKLRLRERGCLVILSTNGKLLDDVRAEIKRREKAGEQ